MSERQVDRRAVAAFAGWAVLLLVQRSAGAAVGEQTFYNTALPEAIAGGMVLAIAGGRSSWVMPRRAWGPLLLLATMGLAEALLQRPFIHAFFHVTYLRGGVQSLVFVAMPLWLALLAALRWVPDEVPRRVVAAALAGVGAFCLLMTADAFALRLREVPALLLTVLYVLGLAWSWSYARRALRRTSPLAAAGWGLLISAVVQGIAGVLIPVSDVSAPDWAKIWLQLAVTTIAVGAGAVLWFFLLQRLELAAFSMQPLAVFTATTLVSSIYLDFLNWRVDLALLLGLGAMATALRARLEDDEPLRLGVAGPG